MTYPHRPWVDFACRCFVAFASLGPAASVLAEPPTQADIVRVGESSGYITALPAGKDVLDFLPSRTSNLTGPTPTNQWWSSLVFKKYSQPMFPHPLAVHCTEAGLLVGYPGREITAGAKSIHGRGLGKAGDLRIGHSNRATFPEARCSAYSDWSISADFSDGAEQLLLTVSHGSPFVYGTVKGGSAVVALGKSFQVLPGDDRSASLILNIDGSIYGLFGPAGSHWEKTTPTSFTNTDTNRGYFSVAVLPDASPATIDLFTRLAHNHITDTKVSFSVSAGTITTTYQATVKSFESQTATDNTATLLALYPHQWKYLPKQQSPADAQSMSLSYASVRGEMKLLSGSSFTTHVPVQGILPYLPSTSDQPKELRTLLKSELAEVLATAARERDKAKDTYWAGKDLGKLATLSGVAESLGDTESRDLAIAELKLQLERWFTPQPGKTAPVFYYNSTWGTLIGQPSSYGSERCNDHHFHYGYFIRAAGEIARVDRHWAKRFAPMVELLIRDIASADRNDKLFPYMRCFDLYAGHSWAAGDANFADGNNQESSSEALNAWYGLALWGENTGDAATRDLGLFLFNTERTAVEEYWFDVGRTNFPKTFDHPTAAIIWGAKAGYETWFSADPDCIHGINWLPFTPGSLYLGRDPEYAARNVSTLISRRPAAGDFSKPWGDLVLMYLALSDPARAAKLLAEQPNGKLESGNTRPFMVQWISTLNQFGTVDASVTSDQPWAVVFNKNGRKTYVAANMQPQPITVRFSDGKQLPVSGGSTAVSQQ